MERESSLEERQRHDAELAAEREERQARLTNGPPEKTEEQKEEPNEAPNEGENAEQKEEPKEEKTGTRSRAKSKS